MQIAYGAEDDSLSLQLEGAADVDLIWLDTGRLTGLQGEGLAHWLIGRLAALRAQTDNPVLCLASPLDEEVRQEVVAACMPGIHIVDLSPLRNEVGHAWLDPRTLALSGTMLSHRAALRIARELACRWVPACVLPPIKAVVVDLDETLFSGVIGEDGIGLVTLTPSHRRLQQHLVHLHDRGIFLALVSRNEYADVEALFAMRPDFPLRLTHFSSIQASWDEKALAVTRVADDLRIGADSMIFVDDNPGDLEEVASRLPVFTIHASRDADETWRALAHVGGLHRWTIHAEDGLRADDLRWTVQRQQLGDAMPASEYLRNLEVRLRYAVNSREAVHRAHELVHKTNQFNLSLRRTPEAELTRMLGQHDARLVTIALADRLSNSGTIAVLAATLERGGDLRVDELCVSCRALGRRLEDTMLTQALLCAAGDDQPGAVVFRVAEGPRNAPARRWLAAYVGLDLAATTGKVVVPFDFIRAKRVDDAVEIELAD